MVYNNWVPKKLLDTKTLQVKIYHALTLLAMFDILIEIKGNRLKFTHLYIQMLLLNEQAPTMFSSLDEVFGFLDITTSAS